MTVPTAPIALRYDRPNLGRMAGACARPNPSQALCQIQASPVEKHGATVAIGASAHPPASPGNSKSARRIIRPLAAEELG